MNRSTSSSDAYFDLMSAHLTGAALDLFAACELSIEPSDSTPEMRLSSQEPACVASIGYVGEGVRGVLVLAAAQSAAQAWVEAAGVTDCDLADTIGEFSNMLLGHLKGRLVREGIPLSVATPVTVSGAGLRFSVPPGHSGWQFFEGPGWRLSVRLDASFESCFRIQEVDDTERAVCPGEAMLF